MQPNYFDVNKNAELALEVFNTYYRRHIHSGKFFEEMPDFFLVKPEVLDGQDIATRPSDKLLIDDAVKLARERNGHVAVYKHRNPKLGYFWLELAAGPFMLGDKVTADNKGEFFFLVTKFIEFTRQYPKIYGNLTAEAETDKDLAMMFNGIKEASGCLQNALKIYPEKMLVAYNPKWPITQVERMMHSLKENDLEWCDLFFEYLIYVMGNKSKS